MRDIGIGLTLAAERPAHSKVHKVGKGFTLVTRRGRRYGKDVIRSSPCDYLTQQILVRPSRKSFNSTCASFVRDRRGRWLL